MAISMNFFSKMMFGMGLVNAVLLALSDSKLTAPEIVQILQFAVTGLGSDLKIGVEDFQIVPGADGSVSLVFSKALVDKLQFTM